MTAISKPSLKILPATPEDAEIISAISQLTFVRKFGHLYSEDNLNRFLEDDHGTAAYKAFLDHPDYGVWKVVDDATGRLAGYALASIGCGLPIDGDPDEAGEVKRLYVLDEYQGSGLGKDMLQVMMDWICQNRHRPIYLSVYKYNDGAQRFYKRFGFSLHKEYKFMVGDHADPEYIFFRP